MTSSILLSILGVSSTILLRLTPISRLDGGATRTLVIYSLHCYIHIPALFHGLPKSENGCQAAANVRTAELAITVPSSPLPTVLT